MGFLDKAKKMAEQAQAKLDEVQGQFNQSHAGQPPSGPVTEYDKHGRPVTPAPDAAAPVTPDAAAPAPEPPAETPGVPPTEPAPPAAGPAPDPAAPTTPGSPPSRSDDTPPKLSSGDPLAG